MGLHGRAAVFSTGFLPRADQSMICTRGKEEESTSICVSRPTTGPYRKTHLKRSFSALCVINYSPMK